GIGELRLLWPTLARLSQADGMVALVDPPYLPFAQGWARAGIDLKRLQVVRTDPRNALWATEQCLRSAACSAVLCWPRSADDRTLRRLQVAAETGQCLGFAMRPLKRSEEHTSELQSRENLVCRLLLEKKKKEPQARRDEWADETHELIRVDVDEDEAPKRHQQGPVRAVHSWIAPDLSAAGVQHASAST